MGWMGFGFVGFGLVRISLGIGFGIASWHFSGIGLVELVLVFILEGKWTTTRLKYCAYV
jgi:hypothetical protein